MAQDADLTGLLTIGEAARVAGVSPQAVHGWIGRGRLRPRLTDDGHRVDADDLFRLLAARRAAAVAGVGLGTVLRWADGAGDPRRAS
jgi:DNA-binding transcriptional MerR regulator